jgi:formylmethanofuran dehydrogenase subunit B
MRLRHGGADSWRRLVSAAGMGIVEEMTATAPDSADAAVWIDGEPTSFDLAVSQAARLIGDSVMAVFAHLGTDAAGSREAVWLAEQVGGVLDHASSAAMFSDLDAMRETGVMLTTPLEAAVRADVVWLIGDSVFEAWPELESRILARARRSPGENAARRVVWTRTTAVAVPSHLRATTCAIGEGVERLAHLAQLRARANRRIVSAGDDIEAVAAILRDAKFGVAVWSAAELEPLAIEAINGLVRDLNNMSRFSTLPLVSAGNGAGVEAVCAWMTGFPLRTGFARGAPHHDPWRYDSRRLISAGETDCVVWISSFERGAAPRAPVHVALCEPGVAAAARVRIDVARPGVDHDAVLYDPRIGALVVQTAARSQDKPTVAATLAAIRAEIGSAPC